MGEGADADLKKDLKDKPAFLNVTDLKYGTIGSTYAGAKAEQKFEMISDEEGSLSQRALERPAQPQALTAKHLLLGGALVSLAAFAVVARQLRWWHVAFSRGDVQ